MTSALLRLSGAGWAETPHNAVYNTTNSDIRIAVALDNASPSAQQPFVSKYAGTTQKSWVFQYYVSSMAVLEWDWSNDGTSNSGHQFFFDSDASLGASNFTLVAYRETFVAATRQTKFFKKATTYDTAYADCLSNSGWTQIGSTFSGAATTLFAGTSPVRIGTFFTNTNVSVSPTLTGNIAAAVIKDDVDGTTIADPDFTAQTPGATSFTDASGRTWTLNGDAAILGSSVTVGIASETDTSFAVSLSSPSTNVSVGLATETSTALTLASIVAGATAITVGIAIESDSALAIAATIPPGLWTFQTPVRARIPLSDTHPLFSRISEPQATALVQHADGTWAEYLDLPQTLEAGADYAFGRTDRSSIPRGKGFGVAQNSQGQNLNTPADYGFQSPLRIYRGGHVYCITSALRTELLNAVTNEEPNGYGAYMTSTGSGKTGDEIMRSGRTMEFEQGG